MAERNPPIKNPHENIDAKHETNTPSEQIGSHSRLALRQAILNPSREALTPAVVFQIQRMYGNRFTLQLLRSADTQHQARTMNQVTMIGSGVIQRAPGDHLSKVIEKWKKVRSDKRDSDIVLSAEILHYVQKGQIDGGALLHLEKSVNARLADTHDKKKIKVLNEILAAIEKEKSEELASIQDVDDYLESQEFKALLAASMPQEKADNELIHLRTTIIHQLFTKPGNPYYYLTLNKDEVADKVKQIITTGVMDGYWVGRGLCDQAALVFGSAPYKFSPTDEVNWNHSIVLKGGVWIDPTYRQFFSMSEWGKGPAIFKGNVDDFRKLGLDAIETEKYIKFISKRENDDKKNTKKNNNNNNEDSE